MEFFQYQKPFTPSPDGSVVVGAVRMNQQMYRVEKQWRAGGVRLCLMPVFARVFHPLDPEIQEALIDLWVVDRVAKLGKA